MLEKYKAVDNKEAFGALLTDLSKAFDCLNHEHLIVKLHAYRLSFSSLKLVHDYLLNCKQRTKVNSKYSSWTDTFRGCSTIEISGFTVTNSQCEKLLGVHFDD